MTDLLPNYLGGRWVDGRGDGATLRDPVTATALVRVSSEGLDLANAFAYARDTGGRALRALTFGQRAAMLGEIVKTLQANRDAYFDIAIANSGTTRGDSAVDIEGSIYTLGQFARWGAALGDARALAEGGRSRLAKDGAFQCQHVLVPARGVALLINAFNFPAWGLWEKAAAALLSGVPVIVKPATATAWLAQRMVADVVAARIVPDGRSVDHLRWFSRAPRSACSHSTWSPSRDRARPRRRSAATRDCPRLDARERRGRQLELRAADAGRRRGLARLWSSRT